MINCTSNSSTSFLQISYLLKEKNEKDKKRVRTFTKPSYYHTSTYHFQIRLLLFVLWQLQNDNQQGFTDRLLPTTSCWQPFFQLLQLEPFSQNLTLAMHNSRYYLMMTKKNYHDPYGVVLASEITFWHFHFLLALFPSIMEILPQWLTNNSVYISTTFWCRWLIT